MPEDAMDAIVSKTFSELDIMFNLSSFQTTTADGSVGIHAEHDALDGLMASAAAAGMLSLTGDVNGGIYCN